ncbi:MAG: hypothetical protein HOO88_08615 [Kiritimatiellaceae bacterium]|nr:hypothetical protein [Kiritimatiellaceae bacterium]
MKKIVSILVLLSLGASGWAAPLFTRTADGNWSALSQWKDNGSGKFAASSVLPGSEDNVVVNSNRKVTLDTDSSVALFQIINSASSAIVDVDGENTLTAELIQVGLNSTGLGILNQTAGTISSPKIWVGRLAGNPGTYNLSGGALDMNGSLNINSTGLMNVNGGTLNNSFNGAVRTISGAGTIKLSAGSINLKGTLETDRVDLNGALFEVSGGTVNLGAQVRVGGKVPAEFRVVGHNAAITFGALDQDVATKGTFKFVFDTTGISPIQVTDSMKLSQAKIVVDGSAYTGNGGTFTLFSSAGLVSVADINNITIIGFGSKTAAIVQDEANGKVQLVVTPSV